MSVLTKYRYFYIILEKGILPNWWQGLYEQLLAGIRDSLSNIFSFQNKSVNSWTCQLYYYAFPAVKLTKFKIDPFLHENLTMAHWIRLSLLCRCKWLRRSQVSGKNVSEQYLFVYEHKSVYCVNTRNLGANLWLLLDAESMFFGCMSMARLGACMWLLGACLTVGSFAWL